MSNKRIFFGVLFLVIITWIGSCKPKNSAEVNPNDVDADSLAYSPCVVLDEKINGVIARTYEYDTAQTLIRMLEYSTVAANNRLIKRYTFEYDKRKVLVTMRETNLATRDQSFIYNLSYTDGVMSKIVAKRVFNSGAVPADTLRLTYDGGRVIGLESTMRPSYKWEYDSLGNVKRWLLKRTGGTADSVLGEYSKFDNKTNLYAFARGIQLVNLLAGTAPNRRNPLLYRVGGQDVEALYTYSDRGVPSQTVLKFKNTGDTLSRETVYSYGLNCR